MPSPPRLAKTTSTPNAFTSRAASITSPIVFKFRPTINANSSAFGFITVAQPSRAQYPSGSPDVSRATFTPCACMRSKIGCKLTYSPDSLYVGSAPAMTSHSAPFSRTVLSVNSTIEFQSSWLSGRGVSLTLVVVPPCSRIVVETRSEPSTHRGVRNSADPVRTKTAGSALPIGTIPGALMFAKCRPRETLMPFPASSSRTSSARFTAPECRLVTKYVRSRVGAGVNVTIGELLALPDMELL